jgi:hypothetical protein
MRDNMTNNIEEPKPSNKKLWLIMAGVSIAIIGCAVVAFGLSANSSDKTPNGSSTSQSTDTSVSSTKGPTIETVATSATAKEVTFSIKVTDVDTKKWSLQYEIADQDRVVKGEGKERTSKFNASVKLGSSAYYRIKVRAVNDEGKTTDWSENYTVKLSEVEGFKTIEPVPEYYQTGWATGTDATLEGAKEGIQTAWNAEQLDRQHAVDRCLPINSGNMTPKLLLPPLPSVIPKEVTLKYMINSWNGSAINITYLWCQ